MATVPADLRIPELTDGPPGPGKRVRFKLFASTPPVVLYLPTDWSPERKFPVIVELAGNGNYKNAFGDISTGLPEGSSLGYGLSEGRGCVWACLPFLNHTGDAVELDALQQRDVGIGVSAGDETGEGDDAERAHSDVSLARGRWTHGSGDRGIRTWA
jgi:hypothetical protein